MEMEPLYMVSLAIDKLKPRYDSYDEQQKSTGQFFLKYYSLKMSSLGKYIGGTCDIVLNFYKQFVAVCPIVTIYSHRCFCKLILMIIIIFVS